MQFESSGGAGHRYVGQKLSRRCPRKAFFDPAFASSKTIPEVQSLLGAYHEFEQSKLQTALLIPEYNPLSHKNQNDIIDSEQLIYLSDPSLCMLTADKGIKSKVVKSEQAARIVVATPEDLSDAKKAEAVVGCALGI
jgi:hypothetical protein